MPVYVWEEYKCDWSCGLAVVEAPSLSRARAKLVLAEAFAGQQEKAKIMARHIRKFEKNFDAACVEFGIEPFYMGYLAECVQGGRELKSGECLHVHGGS